MSKDGRFFRHAAQGAQSLAIANMRHPNVFAEAERLAQIEFITAVFADLQFELSEPFVRPGPLAEGWFRPLTHTSFVLTLQS